MRRGILTVDKSKCAILFMILAISCAAAAHLARLSTTIVSYPNPWPTFSAFAIAAWCKQIVALWSVMFRNMVLELEGPAGRRRCEGRCNTMFRRMLSILRWERQTR